MNGMFHHMPVCVTEQIFEPNHQIVQWMLLLDSLREQLLLERRDL
jgi:hypothetical protein